MKLAILSNVNVESLARRVRKEHDVYIADGFGAWLQELSNPNSGIWAAEPEAVVLLIDGMELLRGQSLHETDAVTQELRAALSIIESAALAHSDIKLFVSTMDLPPRSLSALRAHHAERRIEADWLEVVEQLARTRPNCVTWDAKELVEDLGRQRFYSAKRWYFAGIPYSVDGEKALAADMLRLLRANQGVRKKGLVLDLDNTLWGGVIGEDGVSGLDLSEVGPGARYKDFQRRLKELRELGILLTVCSKNNEGEVREAFATHPHMVLTPQDFAATRINWEPKTKNIMELAAELNIGLDSLVFIDDNPVERGIVSAAIPELLVPEFPRDTSELGAFIQGVYREHMLLLESTEEDRHKTELYRQNTERYAAMKSSGSVEDFLFSMEMQLRIWELGSDDVARAAQLTQKTNQFNLTTRRYTEQEIQRLMDSERNLVFIAQVTDRYGDNGKVCLAVVDLSAGDVAELDTFLMSCRVMGRHIEDQVFEYLLSQLRARGVSGLRVRYLQTKRNAPAKAWCEHLQAEPAEPDEEGNLTWQVDVHAPPRQRFFAELIPGR